MLHFMPMAQKVRWNHNVYTQRTAVKLGKRFEDSGLADILLEAGTVAQGSLPWVMKGRHYNRSVRVIKIMVEALRRKLLSTFMGTLKKKINSLSCLKV